MSTSEVDKVEDHAEKEEPKKDEEEHTKGKDDVKEGANGDDNSIEGFPSHGIDVVEELIKKIDGFATEIEEFASKDIDQAKNAYIKEGKFVVRTKTVINGLQNNAYRLTTGFSNPLLDATFEVDEVQTAFEQGNSKPLEGAVANLKSNIKSGMKCINAFNSLCEKSKAFCIKLEQVAKNQINQAKNSKTEGKISTISVTGMAFLVAIVLGVATVAVAVMQSFKISNVVEIGIAIIIVGGLVIYAIAKILSNKRSDVVYDKTTTSLSATQTAIQSLQNLIDEFKILEREPVALANDILRLISQFEDRKAEDDVPDDFVSSLHAKCEELNKSVSEYKENVATPIENLDALDKRF